MRLNAALRRRQGATNPAEDATVHRGDLYNAIPEHRSLYVSSLILRALSVLIGAGITGAAFVLGGGWYNTYTNGLVTLAFGGPTGIMTLVWGLVDLAVILIRDRGFLSAARRKEERKKRSIPVTPFSWGPPAIHVTVHLTIWVTTLVFCYLLWQEVYRTLGDAVEWTGWDEQTGVSGWRLSPGYMQDTPNMMIVPILQMVLVLIHFILFVLACVATDDKLREYSDIIFISREQGKEDEVTTLPSSLWETVRPRKLPMAVAVNQFVRFVPGEDGTVRVAGEFGSTAS